MPLSIDLTVTGAALPIELRAGLSTIIVGANGSGKTKLAIECERQLEANAHRISAQRMLALDPEVEKTTEEYARSQLRYGARKPTDYGPFLTTRNTGRWGNTQPRFILNDAGALLQVLFAEQANTAVKAFNAATDGAPFVGGDTLMRKLKAIYHRVLPTRRLEITADDITACALKDNTAGEPYSITQMSDGEKAVFYVIGQVLVADQSSIFIMDEPEIHVHRSILSRLWDELEAARPDCAFLLITHDLEFAASRAGRKYMMRSYAPDTGWVIENVPEAEGFSEELVTLILGSRKPVLFVEGEQGSLDLAFYRACYPGWTVVPRGGCEAVIHSVVTMRRNEAFTRIQCSGLVDADGHDEADRASLAGNGIQILPVSEIENLLLLPAVSRTILEMNELKGDDLETKLAKLKDAILDDARIEENVNEVVLGYCRRRIDRMLKQVDLSADKSIAAIAASYTARTTELDVVALAADMKTKITAAVAAGDLASLLAVYDRKKPLLALASAHLRNWKIEVFTAWVTRAIQSSHDDRLHQAIRAVLPEVTAA
ncbi:AAA family ATPase [Pseudomonas batumici]|uniref:AAA family ATPase n=1 Tax=Pseudomonas batumici TaxID=226910 RepID=UPI0030D60810